MQNRNFKKIKHIVLLCGYFLSLNFESLRGLNETNFSVNQPTYSPYGNRSQPRDLGVPHLFEGVSSWCKGALWL